MNPNQIMYYGLSFKRGIVIKDQNRKTVDDHMDRIYGKGHYRILDH